MATQTDSISIHMPKYETESVRFQTPTSDVSNDIANIQNYISETAEKNLVKCKSFEVSLPRSITGITNDSNRVKFNSLFQTPTLNELEIVSTNPNGSSIKLNDEQLKTVRETGEFEVNSIHFVGQKHRWKLSQLLQSGVRPANERFFEELSWAVYMMIIFAKDRIFSNGFSFKSSLRSLKQGFINLIDAFIGLPAVYSHGIDLQVENERSKFLAIELSPHTSEKEMHEAFCVQIPTLFDIMIEHETYSRRENKTSPPRMLPYPHHFITPNNIDIDLRLYNRDLQIQIQSIVSSILKENTPKNWFNTTKRRLINQYKQEQSNLTKNEIAKCVQTQLNTEYAERIFHAIENSNELEELSANLGRLLVAHARAILTMKSVVDTLNNNLDQHLKQTQENIIRQHSILSRIQRWIKEKLFLERLNYIQRHEWDAHQLSIEQCKILGNQQAAYFIQRDFTFRKDHESVLRLNLKAPVEPIRTFNCSRSIWLPKNWIVTRQYPLPIERIPTQFAKNTYSTHEEEARLRLLSSNPDAVYTYERKITYPTTTKYPFWRWKLFVVRSFCWLSNAIFTLCLVIPFASPVSFRALFSPKAFYPDYDLNTKDLKLHENKHSKTQTFISRLVALWQHVRHSRVKFEQIPDRGFLGKNMQRMFNRLWNYLIKGFVGTVAICVIYPVSCLVISTGSFILGVLSPIWMPILSLIVHLLQILFYDANSAGEYSRKLFCLINIVITDILICGVIQPVFVLGSLIASPLISLLLIIYAVLHRCSRGLYDKIIYQLIVKRFARIPAHNSFLARRIAGPGLAAEYFYQVSSPEVLAALESLIEQNELKVYRTYMERILMKPIDDYREFFNNAFQPFSAVVQTINTDNIYTQMNNVVSRHIHDLKTAIAKRDELLQLHRTHEHNRIRLTENDLTAVLIEGTQLVEKWYPTRILSYYNEQQIEHFWNDQDLQPNDWFGLTSKLLQQIFCNDFLTPLEQTDVYYSLHVEHLTLSKYAQMIHSANLRDDLDAVTSVYLPETSYAISHPTFNEQMFNPNEHILNISTNYSQKRRLKTHGRIYHYINHQRKRSQMSSCFVDYTSITCRFSIPIRLSEIIYINLIIYNRDHNHVTTNMTMKNLTPQDIQRFIEFYKKFYKDFILPTYSTMILSRSMIDDGSIVENEIQQI